MSERKIRLLPGMKFMLGGVLYRPGDILPDNDDTRRLIKAKEAEWLEDEEEDLETDGSGETAKTSTPEPTGYWAESVKVLTEMLKTRSIDIPKGAKKADLVALLEADDNEGAA